MKNIELKKRIKSMEMTLRAYLTEKSNPEILQRTIRFHNEQINFHREAIEKIEARVNGFEHIDIIKTAITLAKKKLYEEKATTITKKTDYAALNVYNRLIARFGSIANVEAALRSGD